MEEETQAPIESQESIESPEGQESPLEQPKQQNDDSMARRLEIISRRERELMNREQAYRAEISKYQNMEREMLDYKNKLRELDELDKDRYRETEIEGGPVIGSSGSGWHADGMHQVDAHELSSGNWIAAVDGYRSREVVNWRAALRTLQSRVLRPRR